LYPGSAGFKRQEAYAQKFGALDIIGLSLRSDGAQESNSGPLHIHPTNSSSRFSYLFDAFRIAHSLPRPDVVSVQDPFEVGLIGWLIARRFNAPLHVQVHTDFLSPGFAQHSILNRIRIWLAGFVLPRASRIRVVSERIKESIQKKYHPKAPITVLPIFVDIERFRTARADPELAGRFEKFTTKLLVVSRLEPEKNIPLALRAFSKSAPSNACLLVVGEGSERRSLETIAQDIGVSDRMFFEGQRDPAPYYALADLVLVPSRYEGYGLVIVESLAAGKPVLSTDVGIAREAGATIASPDTFAEALYGWFKSGLRTGELKNYPYKNFDDYVRMYCDDVRRCASIR
jgi:glycosyltransferase involved in cell wall biosynthesis